MIYPTLVHMAQPWAMRERLVDGQGNFGSVEGDPPAAMRYTEARLTHLGAVLMEDMDKDTVDFVPNYDETPHRADGVSRRHSRTCSSTAAPASPSAWRPTCRRTISAEIIDGICAQIDDPAITLAGLMKYIKGPDFPTGCMICGVEGIKTLLRDRPRQPEGARQARRSRS